MCTPAPAKCMSVHMDDMDFTQLDGISQVQQITTSLRFLVISLVKPSIQRFFFTTSSHAFLGLPHLQLPAAVKARHYHHHYHHLTSSFPAGMHSTVSLELVIQKSMPSSIVLAWHCFCGWIPFLTPSLLKQCTGCFLLIHVPAGVNSQ